MPCVDHDAGVSVKIHNTYIRYLLLMMVEVQYYEGVEARIEEI